MPIFTYAYIWASKAAWVFPGSQWGIGNIRADGSTAELGAKRPVRPPGYPFLAGTVIIGLTWSATSCLWLYPHTTTYFNELVGGPWGGPRYLSDSNLDWGQDLLHLKRWLDKHPQAKPLGFSYVVPLIDPQIAGIEYSAIPPGIDAAEKDAWGLPPDQRGPQPGWFAISVNHILERRKQYLYFQHFQPVATAGYSIYIYHLKLDEVNSVRREYGMPPVLGLNELKF
jgi:hypothetical protein